MKIGYARTSTAERAPGLFWQAMELIKQGCDKVFQESLSSVAKREQLELALDYLRDGDTLVVTRLDRLARSVAHLLAIVERVKGKKGQHRDWESRPPR